MKTKNLCRKMFWGENLGSKDNLNIQSTLKVSMVRQLSSERII